MSEHLESPRRRNDFWWVGVLLALLIQTAALFSWGGRIAERLDRTTADMSDHELRLRQLERVAPRAQVPAQGRL